MLSIGDYPSFRPRQTDPQFKLRLTPILKERIEKAAEQNSRSMNGEILDRLDWTFDQVDAEMLELMEAARKAEERSVELERIRGELNQRVRHAESEVEKLRFKATMFREKLAYQEGVSPPSE